MNMTNTDFKTIEEALKLLPHGEEFNKLPEETQNIIVKADVTMVNLLKKKKRDNKRIRDDLRKRRAENKAYGRGGKYKGNKVAKYQIYTEQSGVLDVFDNLEDAERVVSSLNKNHKVKILTVMKGDK